MVRIIMGMLGIWLAMFVAWWVCQWQLAHLTQFGSDMPALTRGLLSFEQWGGAVILTVLLSSSWFYAIRKANSLLAWLTVIGLVMYLLWCLLAITLPLVHLCGKFLPPVTLSSAICP